MSDLKKSLDKLLVAIVDKASQKDASLPEMTDALKAGTQYYAVLRKAKKGGDEEDDGEGTFADFEAQLKEPPNGRDQAVRTRRRVY